MALSSLVFYACAFLAVFCAIRVVTARHIFHAALYLAATLGLLAVVYLLLQAEFVAVVQLLVYVGAVIILIIFAVMLTARMGDAQLSQTNRLAWPAALGAGALFLAVKAALLGTEWGAPPAEAASASGAGKLQALGQSLLGEHLLPFELLGLLLFTALVGALLIARKDPE